MIYQTIKISNIKYQISNSSEAGVTLLLAILVLSAIMAIAFSLATILLVEVRISGDLTRTEPAIYAANAVTEEALFTVKRGYLRCTGTGCSDKFSYSTQLGAVKMNDPAPQENLLNDPILHDRVLAISNSIATTRNRYLFFDPSDINKEGYYQQLKVTYLDTAASGQIHVYVCQFKAPKDFLPTDPPINCDNPDSSDMLYKNIILNQGQETNLLTLDSSKQQELIIYSSGSTADRNIQIQAFGSGGVPKGIPYYGETVVDINANFGGVSRALRVRIPAE